MPAILAFLSYNPLPKAATLGEQLVRHRTTCGMSQKEAAAALGLDQGTVARWARGEKEPTGGMLEASRGSSVGAGGKACACGAPGNPAF